METRTFRGFRTTYNIQGNPSDAYFNALPDHDLGALSNYLFRLVKAKRIRTCLDIGANIGLASLLIAELAPGSTIMSFEPSPVTFANLEANVKRNDTWMQVSSQPFAVGNENKVIKFADDTLNSHANHVSNDGSGIDVQMTTIDDFVGVANFESVDFIKIDIEGFELPALEGGLKTLARYRPTVFLEFNEYAIVEHRKMDPAEYLSGLMQILGVLSLVNPSNGETQLLPGNPVGALEALRATSSTPGAIFDLVNQAL